MKYSRQRNCIVECLRERTDHPTADMVFEQVRKTYPKISLGTVYRNLSLLASLGEIGRIPVLDGADRFDAVTAPHYHVICQKCGKVEDLMLPLEETLEKRAEAVYQGKILGHGICFAGICEECVEKGKTPLDMKEQV